MWVSRSSVVLLLLRSTSSPLLLFRKLQETTALTSANGAAPRKKLEIGSERKQVTRASVSVPQVPKAA